MLTRLIQFLIFSVSASQFTVAAELAQYTVVERFSHDSSRYTQGLYWHEDIVLESSGGYGTSSITFSNSQEQSQFVFSDDMKRGRYVFAEGATLFDENIYVLTWKNQIMFQFSQTLKLEKAHRLLGEWWGLTHDDDGLIASNGSDQLAFINVDGSKPEIVKYLRVTDTNKQWAQINELEKVGDLILANIWQTNTIIAIDYASGKVLWQLDLSALAQQEPNYNNYDNVLNGIAFDHKNGHLIVTGKRWQNQFRLNVPKLNQSLDASPNL